MAKQDDDAELRAEAERLSVLSEADYRAILDLHRSVAGNAKACKADRELAQRRVDAMKKFMRQLKRKR